MLKSNEKFFTEATFSQHLDSRYGVRNLRLEDIHSTLKYLLKVFSEYCKENDIKPVIMHGTLIGYYFNKKILPWDDDIDII
jgi:phosphorylcholine metabolism protein LicD